MKLGMDEVLKVPYKCCCFSARSAQAACADQKNKMADNVHVGMESSGDQFVLRLFND